MKHRVAPVNVARCAVAVVRSISEKYKWKENVLKKHFDQTSNCRGKWGGWKGRRVCVPRLVRKGGKEGRREGRKEGERE